MPRSRHQSTTLRRCAGGSTRPVGFDGEFSHSSAGTSGPKEVSESVATPVAPHSAAPTSYVG